jgi:hypothetical protein
MEEDDNYVLDILRACKKIGILDNVLRELQAIPSKPPKNYGCERGHLHAVASLKDALKGPCCLHRRLILELAVEQDWS